MQVRPLISNNEDLNSLKQPTTTNAPKVNPNNNGTNTIILEVTLRG